MNAMENKVIRTGLVIMASGLSKRFGSNKLMENLNNKPIINWIIDTTNDMFDKRVVVTRSLEVKSLCDDLKIQCVLHDLENRNDTVRLGLSELMDEVDYCFFVPGDQPLISRRTISNLIDKSIISEDNIVRTCFGNLVGAPVGFPKMFFDELLNLPIGKGGNWIVNNNLKSVKTVEVSDEYELWDIDTLSDLEKVNNVLKTKWK